MDENARRLTALAHCGLVSVTAQRARANETHEEALLETALSHYQSAIELAGLDKEIIGQAKYSLAIFQMSRKNFNEARNLLKEALENNPYHWRAYTALGQVEMAMNRIDKAILALRKATTLSPDFEFAHYQLGRAYALSTQSGRVELALAAFSKAPTISNAHDEKGRLLASELNRRTDAIASFERAIELNTKSADAYADLAWYLAEGGLNEPEEREKAISAAKRAVAITSRLDWHKLAVLGRVYYDAGQYENARLTLGQSLELNPRAPQLLYHLACIDFAEGHLEAARNRLISFFELSDQGLWREHAASLMRGIEDKLDVSAD